MSNSPIVLVPLSKSADIEPFSAIWSAELRESRIAIAAVIDRPGYVARYKARYEDRLWLMCKSAYCILIERAAKFALGRDRRLRVFFERAGKAEDRDLIAYTRSLKKDVMPFDENNSSADQSLRAQRISGRSFAGNHAAGPRRHR